MGDVFFPNSASARLPLFHTCQFVHAGKLGAFFPVEDLAQRLYSTQLVAIERYSKRTQAIQPQLVRLPSER